MKKEYFVYRLIKDGACIYIGFSENLEDRVKSHRYSGMEFDSVEFQTFSTKEEALNHEAHCILREKPIMNSPHIKGTFKVDRLVDELCTRYTKVTKADVIQCAKEIGVDIVDFNGCLLIIGSSKKLRTYMRNVRDDGVTPRGCFLDYNFKKSRLDRI